ncbi:MAG: glycosyl hydrolase family 18 protein [Lachnospirales bacterium]
MAVAPISNVRQVVEYALTVIPPEKIWLGVPNYGYDWLLPFVKGKSKATSLSSQQAVALARRYGAEIAYDDLSQSPWFRYTDESGREHEVWFEDARSIQAKLALIPEYGLLGAGYWNLMRPFPQNWRVLSSLYQIRKSPS